MLIEARTSDAEMEFLKKDEEYQKRREKSLQQDKILKSMNPPKDIMDQVDLLTCSINDCWSRYADLIYQYALEDILAFLIERQGLRWEKNVVMRNQKNPIQHSQVPYHDTESFK